MSGDPSATFLALQGALAGRYALERELGRGGMGVVYLARDISLDRPVAIKLLPPALAGVASLRQRFLREARTAARLSHPHIVPIHSVEEQGDFVLFVMGYVDGETLGQRIARQGPLPPDDAARILQEVAWALAYAHQHGVVHRDVKPDNILIERATGRALVSDFGIAQDAPDGAPGEVVGTARYMSPEQRAGHPVDGRSDLFSLGATGVVALTAAPFTAPAEAPVGGRLSAILARCLAPDPADRYEDGEALAEALATVRSRNPVVPVAVQRFVDLYRTVGTEISTYAAVVIVLAGETLALASWGNPLFPTVLVYALFVAIGLGALRLAQLVQRARRLFAQGYSARDVRLALERPDAAETEGLPAVAGQPGRTARWFSPRALVVETVAAGGLWIAAWRWWAHASRGAVVDGVLFAILTVVPLVLLRTVIARVVNPAKRGWWSRLWWKTMEWKIFKLARLGRGPGPVAASEPTEVALGAGARALYEALPRELRSRFAEIPALVERLEQQAAQQRREGAGESPRLGTTLAALEGLRLDLLRIGTATGGPDLTADLDAARRIAERIEDVVEAQRELDTPTPVTS